MITEQMKKSRHPSIVYYILSIIALLLIAGSIWWTYPPIMFGVKQLPAYVNLHWAHEPSLLETLLVMLTMIWLLLSAFFWGGWLLRRSVRKIKGQHWRLYTDGDTEGKNNFSAVFPPVLPYLKLSCYYLIFILLFVVLQYPLQFLFFQ